jgi:hypothetical protein
MKAVIGRFGLDALPATLRCPVGDERRRQRPACSRRS